MRRDKDSILADQLLTEASPLAAALAEQQARSIDMVRDALTQRRLRLAYQPVVLGTDPGRIAFHEGLIRVLDRTGRAIPAGDFIGAIETTDLGRRVDCAALEIGLQALAMHPALRLSINMSARSIGYPAWMRTLQRGLALGETVGERLILEITESSAMLVPELVTAFMAEVQAQGVAFALDDFGAGFTSFRYLRDFCFDIMKIDGQFIRNIAQDPDNQALTLALLAVGKHFEMVTIAESVETKADADWLRAAGVGAMQGWLYGVPTVSPDWAEEPRRRRA